MIIKTMKSLKRAPVRAVAVLLFAAVISMIICALQASNDEELHHYEETLKAVPITVTVTRLLESDGRLMQSWILDIFTKEEPVKFYDLSGLENPRDAFALFELQQNTEPVELSLTEYAKDVHVCLYRGISTINGVEGRRFTNPNLSGISSLSCDKLLLPEYGCEIKWYEGYDESIFDGEEPVCIIPYNKIDNYDNGEEEVVLEFTSKVVNTMGVIEDITYQCKLKIVGFYTAGDEKSIYCPVPIIEQVFSNLYEFPGIGSFSFILADNSRLDEFRDKMSFCFVETSDITENIPWRYQVNTWSNEFLPYALDINDEVISDLSYILENSIKFNQTITIFIAILSSVAGFLVGFLMIRNRKRDIILMRTVGNSNFGVYLRFVLEQMICIIIGVAIGGAYYMWNPRDKLLIFAIVYFVALNIALAIFMSKKLITMVKEDE